MYEAAHGSPHEAAAEQPNTGFFNVRTGTGYNGLFKFLSSPGGFAERQETRCAPPAGRVDPGQPHRVRVEWTAGGEISAFFDDVLLVTHRHERGFALRHVFIGTDNAPPGTYGPQHGVIYDEVRVWGSTGPGPADAGPPPEEDAGLPPGEELPFPAEADSWVEPAAPAARHGSDVELRVGGDGRTIYLRFAVRGAGRAAGARLLLEVTNAGGGGDIRRVLENGWSEAELDFVRRPPAEPEILDSLGRVEIGQQVFFDVSAAIARDGVYSFAITSAVDDGS
ncbi:MAG: hypothetical protein FJ125_11370, partial [Deltaproteobacteria bacterium]|nr:hypothetical protein [Deltaproteobacteria bacterium]